MFVVTPDMGNDTCKKSMIHISRRILNIALSVFNFVSRKKAKSQSRIDVRYGILGERGKCLSSRSPYMELTAWR
jgi:hypothetical protein